jgi:hypothetical protein
MKITAFWDIASCSLVAMDRHFRGAYCHHHDNADGDGTDLSNVGKLQRDYTALHATDCCFHLY